MGSEKAKIRDKVRQKIDLERRVHEAPSGDFIRQAQRLSWQATEQEKESMAKEA